MKACGVEKRGVFEKVGYKTEIHVRRLCEPSHVKFDTVTFPHHYRMLELGLGTLFVCWDSGLR